MSSFVKVFSCCMFWHGRWTSPFDAGSSNSVFWWSQNLLSKSVLLKHQHMSCDLCSPSGCFHFSAQCQVSEQTEGAHERTLKYFQEFWPPDTNCEKSEENVKTNVTGVCSHTEGNQIWTNIEGARVYIETHVRTGENAPLLLLLMVCLPEGVCEELLTLIKPVQESWVRTTNHSVGGVKCWATGFVGIVKKDGWAPCSHNETTPGSWNRLSPRDHLRSPLDAQSIV